MKHLKTFEGSTEKYYVPITGDEFYERWSECNDGLKKKKYED